MDGGSGNDSMAGDNAIIWRRGDDFSPRFRFLTETNIYTTGPDQVDTIITNIDGNWRSDPDDAIGRDIQLVDHYDEVETTPLGRFGDDVMAGGADSDVMFGELGKDLMQGDGYIGDDDLDPDFITYTIDVNDSGSNPDTDEILFFNIPEQMSDADDYMEGNGGSDLMFGGLGQDDIIGGSSALFGLDEANAELLGYIAEEMRPDDSDIIFGGAGAPARLVRNDFVGGSDTDEGTAEGEGALPTENDPSIAIQDRHSRDADFIMGDNANVYRLVKSEDAFLEFNYDQDSSFEDRGDERIIPRAMEQLDYTLGGADYAGGSYTDWGAANDDNGRSDLIHGESGDDYIIGMTGSDVIYGESDDDDIIGGYGNDWISGGTGQDGVLGDDGLLFTSRNSTVGEPLYSIEGLLPKDESTKYNNGNALDEIISTPGDIQYAVINVEGRLKKTVDLVPFSFDSNWLGTDDEFPDDASNQPFADDIIFGGLDSDWLHGGSGDDAISGAEALEHAYVPTFDEEGEPDGVLDLGYNAFDLPAPIYPGNTVADLNPGNVLMFNPVDLDGQHLNNRFRAGEFYLYDEYDPLRIIQLNSNGELWKPGDVDPNDDPNAPFEFLLNFDQNEGVFRLDGWTPGNQNQSEYYPDVNDDGKDAIFGDLGNDWLVGGTGRDNIYGGWGNDLINADDDQTTPGDEPKHGGPLTEGANDVPDTHPTYEDRAYGGAGRDILIANTGGDRLIDWVGEYNSYLVPYAPFGQASVSRTLMPHLQEFLYALSDGDGADPTRYADAIGGTPPEPTNNNPIPSRNGEPHGELGLVLQKDFAWQDQTGAPADPQAGNIPGGKRDVLRTAGFNDGESKIAYTASGVFEVQNGVLAVSAEALGGDAISVMAINDYLPSYFEVAATLTMVKPTGGWKANAYIIFDYQDETNFKFAGIDASRDKIQLGHRTEDGWIIDAETPSHIKPGKYYNVLVAVNGTNVTVRVDGTEYFSHTYEARVDEDGWVYGINEGLIGLGSDNSRGTFDNIVVQVLPPEYTHEITEDFADANVAVPFVWQGGDWQIDFANGRYDGVSDSGDWAISLVDLGTALRANSILDVEATVNADATTGMVFDYYGPDDFKYAGFSAVNDTLIIGHFNSGKWVVDASVDIDIESGMDYQLSLSLKGTTVDVSLKNVDPEATNWIAKLGYAFNGVTVDGAFGLLAKEGTASFDTVTVRTDDPSFASETETLLAATAPDRIDNSDLLTQEALAPIVDEAILRLTEAYALDQSDLTLLESVQFEVAALDGLMLGETSGTTVLIDDDAAGFGWFVDATPGEDIEFRQKGSDDELLAAPSSDAYGDMDLLTVVMHELGHVIGLDHTAEEGLMDASLDPSTRYLADETDITPLALNTKTIHDDHQTRDNSASLVRMDASERPARFKATNGSKYRSWVSSWLLDGAEEEAYDPNGNIQLMLFNEKK
jgi:Ca2+-binding RTX toxin-like protein